MKSLGQVRAPWGCRKILLREGTQGRKEGGKKREGNGREEGGYKISFLVLMATSNLHPFISFVYCSFHEVIWPKVALERLCDMIFGFFS